VRTVRVDSVMGDDREWEGCWRPGGPKYGDIMEKVFAYYTGAGSGGDGLKYREYREYRSIISRGFEFK
jgi:hypothetical protein